jgi:DNA repair protein RecO (recombination protein O)
MIRKTQGIVLRHMRFQESANIVTLYTRDYGRLDAIVHGVRRSGGKKGKQALFQLLNVLEIVFNEKQGRELQLIQDASFLSYYQQLNIHPVRSVYALLVAEVFVQAVREQEANPPLFDLLRNELQTLDEAPGYLFEHVVIFILELTKHLGLYPLMEQLDSDAPIGFDLTGGLIHNVQHEDDLKARYIYLLSQYPEKQEMLSVPAAERKGILQLLFRFFQLHLEYFRWPQSLDVFEQVFLP